MTINFSRNIRLVGSFNSVFSFSFPSPPPLLIHPFLDAKFIRLYEKSSSVPKAITSDLHASGLADVSNCNLAV